MLVFKTFKWQKLLKTNITSVKISPDKFCFQFGEKVERPRVSNVTNIQVGPEGNSHRRLQRIFKLKIF